MIRSPASQLRRTSKQSQAPSQLVDDSSYSDELHERDNSHNEDVDDDDELSFNSAPTRFKANSISSTCVRIVGGGPSAAAALSAGGASSSSFALQVGGGGQHWLAPRCAVCALDAAAAQLNSRAAAATANATPNAQPATAAPTRRNSKKDYHHLKPGDWLQAAAGAGAAKPRRRHSWICR